MILQTTRQRIFLYRGVCDLRRSYDRLGWMVKEYLKEDPLTGDLFVFLNRRRNMLKALYWDKDGYAIWQKRLEEGRFNLPEGEENKMEYLEWIHLLEGVKVTGIKRLKRYKAVNFK